MRGAPNYMLACDDPRGRYDERGVIMGTVLSKEQAPGFITTLTNGKDFANRIRKHTSVLAVS